MSRKRKEKRDDKSSLKRKKALVGKVCFSKSNKIRKGYNKREYKASFAKESFQPRVVVRKKNNNNNNNRYKKKVFDPKALFLPLLLLCVETRKTFERGSR